MNGFFVTVNCSKIFDYNESSYKIFIDTNKMSIVYELKEWIRFMFDLEECFFLLHENSVIHELEDIKVLDILRALEIRPCLISNCIHSKMEKKLFSKLNLFAYWNKMRVHKLFQARCQNIAQKYSQNQQNYLNITEECDSFSLQPHQNFFAEIVKPELRNNQQTVTSFSRLSNNIECNQSQVEIGKQNENDENQLDLKKLNYSLLNKHSNSEEQRFFSQNLKNSAGSNPDSLNSLTESFSSTSGNKKQKIHSKPKKFFTDRNLKRKMGIPFSLGAFLSDMREKAQNQEFKDGQKDNEIEKFCSAQNSSVSENSEDKCLLVENASEILNKSLQKRKRKRKHRKQNLTMDSNVFQTDMSWNYIKQSSKAKPNHIRFSDTDEAVAIEFVETQSKNLCNSLKHNNFLELQDTKALTGESVFLEEVHKSNITLPLTKTQVEVSAKLIEQDIEPIEDNTEKKQSDNFQQNLSDLELLKQKVGNTKICTRFY